VKIPDLGAEESLVGPGPQKREKAEEPWLNLCAHHLYHTKKEGSKKGAQRGKILDRNRFKKGRSRHNGPPPLHQEGEGKGKKKRKNDRRYSSS